MYRLMNSGTVLGLFLQVVPITCLVGAIYVVCRIVTVKKQGGFAGWGMEIMRGLFVCYLTGLINLVLVPGNLWSSIWFYVENGYGSGNGFELFNGSVNLVPSLVKVLAGELVLGSWVREMLVGNLLMFLPMGFFLPLVFEQVRQDGILRFAVAIPVAVELIQLIVGRSLDVDDLLCNFAGILAGYGVAAAVTALRKRRK